MSNSHARFQLSNGEIGVWLEQEAIHIRACDEFCDPVEMTKGEALELAEALKRLAAQLTD